MLELRRTAAGIFDELKSVNLYDFEKALEDEKKLRDIIVPGEIVATLLPVIQIRKDIVKKALTGSPIFPNFLEDGELSKIKVKPGDKVCIFEGETFIGCYNYIGSEDLVAKPEFVLN